VIYFPDLKVIHSGDLITEGMPVMDYNNGASGMEWVTVLDKILALDFDVLIPGHGALLTKERIRSDRQKLVTMKPADGGARAQGRAAGAGVRPVEAGRSRVGPHCEHHAFKGGLKGYYEEMKAAGVRQ